MTRAQKALARSKATTPRQPVTVEHQGMTYTLHHTLAEDDFYRRIRVLNWPAERAAREPHAPHGRRGPQSFNPVDGLRRNAHVEVRAVKPHVSSNVMLGGGLNGGDDG